MNQLKRCNTYVVKSFDLIYELVELQRWKFLSAAHLIFYCSKPNLGKKSYRE